MEGIISGKPDDSKIYNSITSVWGNMMPPGRPLPQELRTLLRLWIEQGAVDDTTCANDSTTTNGITVISSYGAMISHNEGQNCMTCHVSGGTSNAWFVVAGTVYDSTKVNPYPNATVRLYTQPDGQGTLIAEIDADGKGNFYTTTQIDFSQGLYPTVRGINSEYQSMNQFLPNGTCNYCHGTIQPHIYLQSGTPPVQNDSICYSQDVQPILTSNCALSGCHDNITHAGDYIFLSYNGTMASGTVVPHDPANSILYQAITSSEGKQILTDLMPPSPNNPLNQAQINIIHQWISEGALNRDCSGQPCDLLNVTFTGIVWPIIQNSCTGCHSGAAPSGNLHLESYSDVKTIANNGKLLGVINAQSPYPQMPPGTPLSSCRKDQITLWVNNGGNNN
jgi:hypothetical protein